MVSANSNMTRNTPFTSTNHCVVVKRQSLRFLPEHWIENGHVLSLECGKYFMDLRVSENGSEIVWSMAGVRQVLDGSTEELAKIRFLNIIDSLAPASSPHPRLGEDLINPEESASPLNTSTQDDVTLRNIDDSPGLYLEEGKMPNGESDQPDLYVPFEEVWDRQPLRSGSSCILLESVGGDGLGKAYTALVDRWALGLEDTGKGGYRAWRDDKAEDGTWKEIYTFGGVDSRKAIPKLPETPPTDWKVGSIQSLAGREWVVRVLNVVD